MDVGRWNLERLTRPQFIMLCGVPTSGKSTYLANIPDIETYVVLSTDAYIDDCAVRSGRGYSEIYSECIAEAQSHLNKELERAVRENLNIVWDQTNLTPKARKKKLSRIPARYEKIGVWFKISLEEALLRNQQRGGKVVPQRVIMQMMSVFIPPVISEGFANVAEKGSGVCV